MCSVTTKYVAHLLQLSNLHPGESLLTIKSYSRADVPYTDLEFYCTWCYEWIYTLIVAVPQLMRFLDNTSKHSWANILPCSSATESTFQTTQATNI